MYVDLYKKMLMTQHQDQTTALLHVPNLLKPSTVKKFIERYKALLATAGLVEIVN